MTLSRSAQEAQLDITLPQNPSQTDQQSHLALCSEGLFQFGLSLESLPEPGPLEVITAEAAATGSLLLPEPPPS